MRALLTAAVDWLLGLYDRIDPATEWARATDGDDE